MEMAPLSPPNGVPAGPPVKVMPPHKGSYPPKDVPPSPRGRDAFLWALLSPALRGGSGVESDPTVGSCGGRGGGLCPALGCLGRGPPPRPHRSPSPPAGPQCWAVPYRQFGGAAPPRPSPGFCCPSLRLLPPPGLRPPGKPIVRPRSGPAPTVKIPPSIGCAAAMPLLWAPPTSPLHPAHFSTRLRPHSSLAPPPNVTPPLHQSPPNHCSSPSLAPPPFSQQHEESRLNWPWPGQSEHSLGASQPGGGSMARGMGGGSAPFPQRGRGLI